MWVRRWFEYRFSVINCKCFEVMLVVLVVSALYFKADRVTQIKLTVLFPRRFLLGVFASVSMAKPRSASAFEWGRLRTRFNTEVKFGKSFSPILVEDTSILDHISSKNKFDHFSLSYWLILSKESHSFCTLILSNDPKSWQTFQTLGVSFKTLEFGSTGLLIVNNNLYDEGKQNYLKRINKMKSR